MDVSVSALRRETLGTLKDIEDQAKVIIEYCEASDISPMQLRDQNGGYVMIPLLTAKSQCLATLTLLNPQRKK